MTSSSGCHSVRSWSAPDSRRVISSRFWTSRFSRSASSRIDSRSSCRVWASRRVRFSEMRARGPGDRRERRPQVVRDRAEQGVAQALGLDPELGLLGLVGELRALDGEGRLVGERLELMELLGCVERVTVGGPDAEDADGPARRLERQVERRGAGKRGGAEPGGLVVLVDPAGDAQLVRVQGELRAGPGGETRRRIGQQHDHLAVEDLAHVTRGDGQQRVDATRARELPAHGVERRRSLLALAGRDRLGADARRQAADHELPRPASPGT